MAHPLIWIVAGFVLLFCFAAACALAVRRDEAAALAAAQAAGAILVLLVVVLAVWWREAGLMPVALAAVLLSFPGALVMAGLLKREIDQ